MAPSTVEVPLEDEAMVSARSGATALARAGVVAAALSPVLCLVWVLWSFIPTQADVFWSLGMPLSLPGRLAVAASNAFVRWLPHIVVATSVLGLMGGQRLLRSALGGRRSYRVVLAVAVTLGVVCTAASVLAVWGIHRAYADARARGWWAEIGRKLETCSAPEMQATGGDAR